MTTGASIKLEEIDYPPSYEDVAADGGVTDKEFVIMVDNSNVATAVEEETGSGDRESADTTFFGSFPSIHEYLGNFIDTNRKTLRILFTVAIAGFSIAYFIWAMVISVLHQCQNPIPLVVLVCAILVCVIVWFVRSKFKKSVAKGVSFFQSCLEGNPSKVIKIFVAVVAIGGILGVIGVTLWRRPTNAWALSGIVFFVCLLWVFSRHPRKVIWRPVILGLVLQFYFAIIILKWEAGYQMFYWLGNCVQTFLGFADYGSQFVFGEKFEDHIFAMKVLPVVIFFSCVINVLYYVGAMQLVISKIGWLFRQTLRTTAPESLCMAANIFVGMTEAPIVIRPFLKRMTRSELNAIMTGGFATIAGSVLAAYISFGVPPVHLLCASVMNAPCALAVAKLLYPETEESEFQEDSDMDHVLEDIGQEDGDRKEQNIISAAAAGASGSIKLVANIAVNLIAFLSMLALVNAVLSWLGSFLCFPELSFQVICSYLFKPIAFLMGVEWKDAGTVAELIGIKTFLNEFVAYSELAKHITNRVNCTGTMISVRSEVIATYALCGFSNFGSIGITLGGLGPMMDPRRRGLLAKIVLRALFGGMVTCLLTASVAGLLITDFAADSCSEIMANTTLLNGTLINGTMLINATHLHVSGTTMTYLANLTASTVGL